MPALMLRDLPLALYRRLKSEAQRNKRSMNRHAVSLLEEALTPPPKLSADSLPKAVRPRRAIDDAFILKAVSRGRA
jgi:hypothetical protein